MRLRPGGDGEWSPQTPTAAVGTFVLVLLMLRVQVDGGAGVPTGGAASASVDVVVDLDPEHRVADLAHAVARHLGHEGEWLLGTGRSAVALDPTLPVARSAIVQGDEVWLCRSTSAIPRPPHVPDTAVAADVVGGPDAGRSIVLSPGRYVVGRGGTCDVVIDDQTVERRHAVLVIDDDGTVEVAPERQGGEPPSVRVDGVPIEAAVVVHPDDEVALGATRLMVRSVRLHDAARAERVGQVEFRRTPYRPPAVSERRPAPLGPVPRRPDVRRFQVLSVLAPLAAGLVLFAFSRQVQFLALTMVSPLVMLANSVDDRRSGRRAQREAVAAFRDDVVVHRLTLDRLRRAELVERRQAAPDLADLARRAELRTIDLWPRGRVAPDFLRLRIGVGAAVVAFPIEVEPGGDDALRAEAQAALEDLARLEGAPVTVDVARDGVVAAYGAADVVDGVVASLLAQSACLHSVDDLVIVAAMPPERGAQWMKWLPHLRSSASPIAGRHLARRRDQADRLVADLLDVVAFRRESEIIWPRVLLVVDPSVGADAPQLARLLDAGPAVGISVLWVASRAADVPHQARTAIACGGPNGSVWTSDPTAPEGRLVELETLRPAAAQRIARHLAPVRDTSTAALSTSIPRVVDLLDCAGHGCSTAAGVAERWLTPAGYGLRFPVGAGAAGPVELDLVHDGPHALIAGTSGAGKSELLQTMVASLATRYPPERLTFLFVDYKGGAASSAFARLPHTVGYVTNLGADLAMRALTSLRAELHHRMAIMEGRAKDLAEMLQVASDEAPPSLVIVVDEFATLVKEIPDFVAGIVDVAQRGRSLGIHLVLATQRPSGAVNEHILANTNLRISLRMLERGESSAVIGTPDAAEIPVPLRGRAIARLGGQHLVPFQCAYGGAPIAARRSSRPVLVAHFDDPHAVPRSIDAAGDTAGHTDVADDGGRPGTDQLGAVIDAVVEAHGRLGGRAPRRPWCEALPAVVELDRVLADQRAELARWHAGRVVVAGVLDAPERQVQEPLLIDLEDGGGWLVFGTGGSGKSTLLRTVAASIERTARPGDVAVVAFDLTARGLMGLRSLGSVVDVATVDDAEAVTRHILVLEAEIERRRAILGAAGAEHLTAYRAVHADLPRIVLLVDGFGGLIDAVADGAGAMVGAAESWVERFVRVVVDGRQVGIHAVITADRRSAVPSRLHAAIANRLLLRHADGAAYAEHGVPSAAGSALEAGNGRGWWRGTSLVQVACVSPDPSALAQSAAIAALGVGHRPGAPVALSSHPLPDVLPAVPEGAVRGPLLVPVGALDVSGQAALLDLRWSHAVVTGPPRSGRSTALAAVAQGFAADHDVYLLGPASSGLAAVAPPSARGCFGRPADALPLLERIDNLCAIGTPVRPIVVVVDDADAFDDAALGRLWERLLAADGVRVVAAVEHRALTGFTTDPLLGALKRARRMLVLQPDDPAEFVQVTGVKLPRRPGVSWVPGRGVLVADRVPAVVQVVQAVGPPAGLATTGSEAGDPRSRRFAALAR